MKWRLEIHARILTCHCLTDKNYIDVSCFTHSVDFSRQSSNVSSDCNAIVAKRYIARFILHHHTHCTVVTPIQTSIEIRKNEKFDPSYYRYPRKLTSKLGDIASQTDFGTYNRFSKASIQTGKI